MVELLSLALLTIPATILALARYRRAQAEHEWAKRCDPTNQHFRQPLIWRGEGR
jgi:hypothetical protein